MLKLTHAQVIAANIWFAGGPKKTRKQIEKLTKYLDITDTEMRNILNSAEYVEAVKTLMLSTRSPRNIIDWIEGYPPAVFGKRMELVEDVAEALMSYVRSLAYLEQH